MSRMILITGATGNIGREVAPMLELAGHTVRGGTRSGTPIKGASPSTFDLLQPDSLQAAFTGADTIVLITPAHPQMYEMTENAVQAARGAGVSHLVRVSGAGADPASEVAIARIQGECDQLVIESGIDYTLLRPKNFMQNFTTFLGDMVRSGTVYSSQGEGRIPFIDVRDIAAAMVEVLTNPMPHVGKAYTLTGPQALTNAEALAIISQETGKHIELIEITEEASIEVMRKAGMHEALIEMMSSLNRIVASGWVADVSSDINRILPRSPLSFDQFAADYREFWL